MIHRTLRDGDPIFREELLSFVQRGNVLQISNFKDNSSPLGMSYSCGHKSRGHF
ncbi:putative clathrin assembly protein [Platanthera zijinensis]|uniref:Clathrin assembly protein n=1 Tax=Platanthera zijinensis TaxID=2320716 RepID=A0AAP0GFB8_9ASPA